MQSERSIPLDAYVEATSANSPRARLYAGISSFLFFCLTLCSFVLLFFFPSSLHRIGLFLSLFPSSLPTPSQKSCVCDGFQRFGLGFSLDTGIHRGQQLEPLPIEHRATVFISRRVLSSLSSSRFPTVRRPSKAQFNIRRFHFPLSTAGGCELNNVVSGRTKSI